MDRSRHGGVNRRTKNDGRLSLLSHPNIGLIFMRVKTIIRYGKGKLPFVAVSMRWLHEKQRQSRRSERVGGKLIGNQGKRLGRPSKVRRDFIQMPPAGEIPGIYRRIKVAVCDARKILVRGAPDFRPDCR